MAAISLRVAVGREQASRAATGPLAVSLYARRIFAYGWRIGGNPVILRVGWRTGVRTRGVRFIAPSEPITVVGIDKV